MARASLYEKLKDNEKAIEDYTVVINNKSGDAYNRAYAYSFRGHIYEDQDNCVGAIENYTKAIELFHKVNNPSSEAVKYDDRGRCYAKLGEFKLAVTDYTKAIETDPQWTISYANRAVAHLHLNNAQQAVADCTKLLQRQPDPYVRALRARAYRQLGDIAKAEADEAKTSRHMIELANQQ